MLVLVEGCFVLLLLEIFLVLFAFAVMWKTTAGPSVRRVMGTFRFIPLRNT